MLKKKKKKFQKLACTCAHHFTEYTKAKEPELFLLLGRFYEYKKLFCIFCGKKKKNDFKNNMNNKY